MSEVQSILSEFRARGEFDPAEYMRRVRPELFSDSISTTEPAVDRGYFEYHLDTLTNRSQENEFENFARRLAEVEICPNLRPQTGPTGGGDSKTDSSTYPVSEELAERTYWGTPSKATSENWAFAFSCKKVWKPKVRSDIKKIAGLEREYQKVYFISNQFIRDKDRGETEQALSKEHGLEVHILDRSWIVQRVIDHGREDIAIETLAMSGVSQSTRSLGPRDTARSRELEELLDRLSRPDEYYPTDYFLSADYRRAAMLSRGLEKHRHEVDGLFSRARQLAAKFGDTKQIINTCYDYAWTSLWWYEDVERLVSLYLEMESLLPDVVDAEDCESFSNLLTLLIGSLRLGKLSLEDAGIFARLEALSNKLEQLASDSKRPNNALHAETTLWLMRLTRAWEARKCKPPDGVDEATLCELFPPVDVSFEEACGKLADCLDRSSGLATYPLSSTARYILQYGALIDELVPAYDQLFQKASELVRKRSGERAEGEMLLQRGQQLLGNSHFHEALLSLGKARVRLSKEESLEDSCRAALACCDAYFQMELFWAARMEALAAVNLALRVTDEGFVDPFLRLLAAKRMYWCELSLGRFAPSLAWYEICRIALTQLDPDEYRVAEIDRDLQQQFEFTLGCLFLNLCEPEARELEELVGGLEARCMPMARDALAYACGNRDEVANELAELVGTSNDDVHESFKQWRSQMPEDRVRRQLTGETRSHWRFETTMMGVKFEITSRNAFGPILFSENLLGVIEAILALARWENLAFMVDEVTFKVDEDRAGQNPPGDEPFSQDETGARMNAHYDLVFRPDMIEWMELQRSEFCRWLHRFALRVIFDATIDPMKDLMAEFEQWGKEGTFDRALSTSPTCIVVDDLIGKEKYDLNHWYAAPDTSPL